MTADDKQLYCQIIAQLLLIDGAVTDEDGIRHRNVTAHCDVVPADVDTLVAVAVEGRADDLYRPLDIEPESAQAVVVGFTA